MKRCWFILSFLFCLTFATMPLLASQTPDQGGVLLTEAATEISVTELYEKVKTARQTLLETRLEVVRQANEAKQRLEELLGQSGRQDNPQSNETLKKDLEVIREAQKVLTTILSDILDAAIQGEASKELESGLPRVLGTASPEEILPSREYLEQLVTLYEEKNLQLLKVIDSLSSVVNGTATENVVAANTVAAG